jgi:cytosine deaminase
MGLAAGATAVRSHVDVGPDIGLRAVEALVRVRAELSDLIDIQLVALVGIPLSGPEGAEQRALMRDALDAGADLVGGAPHIDDDPVAATDVCVAAAAASGRGLDLHTDESLDPGKFALVDLAQAVLAGMVPGGATASHCVSLGMQEHDVQLRVADLLAEAGVGVVANPQTNLYLQGRSHRTAVPRGLTAIRPLLDAGVTLAAGGDNVRDPFNPLGRADPLEAASLLVTVGHLRVDEAWETIGTAARKVMRLPEVRVEPGYPAELLAIRAGSLTEALATATDDRVVVHRGRIVARTTVSREFPHSLGSPTADAALTIETLT